MAPLCYNAKFDPFLSLDCAPMPSTLAQSKKRKGSKFAIWQPCLEGDGGGEARVGVGGPHQGDPQLEPDPEDEPPVAALGHDEAAVARQRPRWHVQRFEGGGGGGVRAVEHEDDDDQEEELEESWRGYDNQWTPDIATAYQLMKALCNF